MSAGRNDRSAVALLNKMAPAAAYVKLGTLLDEYITKHNALLAKLDADAGVTDTDYVATLRMDSLQDRME